MKQSESKDFWPLIKAWSEGNTLQYLRYGTSEWVDYDAGGIVFSAPPSHYRIKPEPKLRPWKQKEVPVGALLDNKGGWRGLILAVSDDSILTSCGTQLQWEALNRLGYLHSTDGGKTWHPCGVQEDVQ